MSTGIGVFVGLALILGAMALQKGSMRAFLNLEALMICLGGTMAATLISFPARRVLNFFSLVLRLFKEERGSIMEDTVARLVELGHKASQDTIFSLEKDAQTEQNRYLRLGLALLVQDAPANRIKHRFAIEMEGVRSRHQEGIQLFGFMGKIAPSFGLVGTLIGLINMLQGIGSDVTPETLGPSMALALVTTFFGALLAFFLFLPASEKLKAFSAQEITLIQMVREGILMIREGQTSREMEEMLNAYLPPGKRQSFVEKMLMAAVRGAKSR